MSESKPQESGLNYLLTEMVAFEQRNLQRNIKGLEIADHTLIIIQIATVTLIIVSILLFSSIYYLASDLEKSVANMETMYTHFSTMSSSMGHITSDIVAMEANVKTMPDITNNVVGIRQGMDNILISTGSISQAMDVFSGDLENINYRTGQMRTTLERVTSTVLHMEYDVNQMSRPMRLFPLP